jgi:hypothetical protein
MASQDAAQIKEKILSFLRLRGPSLPVHIAKDAGLSILFASAFLSELYNDKKIKMSNMRVGSSPVYFLPYQLNLLERFAEHLKSKEKDAYLRLKENKFLIDKDQEPAIRVAIRAIKDFAIPFEYNGELIWRYVNNQEEEFQKPKELEKPQEIIQVIEERIVEEIKEEGELQKPKEKEEHIIEKEIKIKKEKKDYKKEKIKQHKPEKIQKKKSDSSNKNDKFFNKVKEAVIAKGIEIIDIVGFNKSELTLKINDKGEEKLLIAYNKKRIDEKDLANAYKKASEYEIPYTILSLGEPSKKLLNLIEASKSLSAMDKIE